MRQLMVSCLNVGYKTDKNRKYVGHSPGLNKNVCDCWHVKEINCISSKHIEDRTAHLLGQT